MEAQSRRSRSTWSRSSATRWTPARAHCLTGRALEHGAARRVIEAMSYEQFRERTDEIADAFRAVVWPETRGETKWMKGAVE